MKKNSFMFKGNHSSFSRPSAARCAPSSSRLGVERLESRQLLSASPNDAPFYSDELYDLVACVAQLDESGSVDAIPIDGDLATTAPPCDKAFFQEACCAVLDDDYAEFDAEGYDESLAIEDPSAGGEFVCCQSLDDFLANLELDDEEEEPDELGEGCGCGCGDGCENKVLSAAMGYEGNNVSACLDGYAPVSNLELVVIQNSSGAVTIPASMTGSNQSGYDLAITISNPGTGYWNKSVGNSNDSFVWTKPSSVSNASATRDYTFNFIVYEDVNNNSQYDVGETIADFYSIALHIAYAEIVVSIAGEPFVPLTSTNNKVIVGQKIQAKLQYDSRLSIPENCQRTWSFSSNLNYTSRVKNYTINVDEGVVIELQNADYNAEIIKFHEIQPHFSTIHCGVQFQWNSSSSATPILGSFSAATTVDVIAPSATIAASFTGNIDIVTADNGDVILDCPRIDVIATVAPIGRTNDNLDAGEINFLQTLQDNCQKKKNGIWETKSISGDEVLDTRCPYGFFSDNGSGGYNYQQNSVHLSDYVLYCTTIDKPNENLTYKHVHGYDEVFFDLIFTTSLIYKPNGVDSIWVPLKRIYWFNRARVVDNNSSDYWTIISCSNNIEQDNIMPLQEWSDNVKYYLNW